MKCAIYARYSSDVGTNFISPRMDNGTAHEGLVRQNPPENCILVAHLVFDSDPIGWIYFRGTADLRAID